MHDRSRSWQERSKVALRNLEIIGHAERNHSIQDRDTSAASLFCDGIVRLRVEPPMIVLYRDIAVSTKLRFWCAQP